MIRGVLSTLSTKIIPSLYPRLAHSRLGIQNTNCQLPKAATFTSIATRQTDVITSFNSLSKNSKSLLLNLVPASKEQIRTITKFSLKKGRRKSSSAVPLRFFRLRWGIWIRTISGRHKKLWKKSGMMKRKAQEHVFCNAVQSRLLDTMVSRYWRTPKYYIEDPYEPYHKREEFSITKKKPWRPEGVDYE